MKGLIGIGVFLGCLATAAHAEPEIRIVCTGEPRLDGADEVEISTDILGLVRVVDGPEMGDGGEKGEGDEISVEGFCAAHDSVDQFILPAPRMIDEPRSPDAEDELEPEPPGRPDTQADDKPLETADDDDGSDGDVRAEKHGDLPDLAGTHKSIGPRKMSAGGCSQAVGHTETGWWFALLPLLLLVRVRGEGDR